jgi:hypothetical protein
MTKAQMIGALKMQEAKQWTKVENQKEFCRSIHGEDSTEKDWSETSKGLLEIYTTEWHYTFEMCKLLKVEPFTWVERQTLINESKL